MKGFQHMYKIYNSKGKLISYIVDNHVTFDNKLIFKSYCQMLHIKLNALGVPISDRGRYYADIVLRIKPDGLNVKEHLVYFKGTNVVWTYKPEIYKMFCNEFEYNTKKHLLNNGCIDLSLVDTSDVTNFNQMFSGFDYRYKNLDTIDTSKAITMDGMFYNCALYRLDLTTFDTSKVVSMHEMFNVCDIDILNLSTFDTSKVVTMRNMFSNCRIILLDIRSFIIVPGCDITEMFCDSKVHRIIINRQAFDRIYNSPMAFSYPGMTAKRFKKICKIVE